MRDDDVRAEVRKHLSHCEKAFRRALENAIDKGELRRRDTRALARFLTNSVHGLGVMARAGVSKAALRDVVATTLSVIEE